MCTLTYSHSGAPGRGPEDRTHENEYPRIPTSHRERGKGSRHIYCPRQVSILDEGPGGSRTPTEGHSTPLEGLRCVVVKHNYSYTDRCGGTENCDAVPG